MQSPPPHHLRQSLCILGLPPTRDGDDDADDSPWTVRWLPGQCLAFALFLANSPQKMALVVGATMVPGLGPCRNTTLSLAVRHIFR